MKEIQGYLCIVPNNPDGRGTIHFTEQSALDAKFSFDSFVNDKWENVETFNKDYWKENLS